MIYLGWPELACPSEPLNNCASFEISNVVFPFPRVVLACNGLDKTTFNGGYMEYFKYWRPQLTFHMLFLETFHCWMNLFARSAVGDLGDVYHNQDNLSKSTHTLFFGFHFSLGLLPVFSS